VQRFRIQTSFVVQPVKVSRKFINIISQFSCYKKPILEKFHCTPYKHIDKPRILIIVKPKDESV